MVRQVFIYSSAWVGDNVWHERYRPTPFLCTVQSGTAIRCTATDIRYAPVLTYAMLLPMLLPARSKRRETGLKQEKLTYMEGNRSNNAAGGTLQGTSGAELRCPYAAVRYALSGTEIAYAAICLRAGYAMSGPEIAYAAMWYALSGTEIVYAAICLCAGYAMSGPEIAYAATDDLRFSPPPGPYPMPYA
eukprot:3055203-Rhodomonas_salina.6